MDIVQRGIFRGLALTGKDDVVDILASYLNNSFNRPLLRRGAAIGLIQVGSNRHLYSEEARQRAVTALCHAVEHDSWDLARSACAMALSSLGEKRAISVLERMAETELDDGVLREVRVAAHMLRTSDKGEEQFKELRKDLDEVREENRKLRDQLGAIAARIN
jgi:aminopeptidase N